MLRPRPRYGNRALRQATSAVGGLMVALACRAPLSIPQPLERADLSVGGLSVDDDSASVLRLLGPPAAVDSVRWRYDGLDVILGDGKVLILTLTGPSRATVRGLRVGDRASRASQLYRPCYADSLLVQVCYDPDDFDERAVIAELERGRVKKIHVGRIIEP